MTMPAFYIPHGGGPCFFMDWMPPDTWNALGGWMRSIPATLPQQPKAQIVFSAHWEQSEFTLLTTRTPGLYYDYYDFPPHTYELQWPAPQAPELFDRVRHCMRSAGLPLAEDTTRDFDHGVFVPGLLMYPEAQMPTLQISLRRGLDPLEHLALGRALDPLEHLALGRALAPLREEGVLFVGSGMSFHNMRAFRYGDNTPIEGADVFDNWLTDAVRNHNAAMRNAALAEWEKAPGARFAHPREEHLIPLMVIAGAAGAAPGKLAWHGRAMGAPLSAFSFD